MSTVFRESALAHALLDGLPEGIEIGGAAHNPFNIRDSRCRNVDFSGEATMSWKKLEERTCGSYAPVDIVADARHLPLEDESVDYVISSHSLEHIWDTLGAMYEWLRVIRPAIDTIRGPFRQPGRGGYLFITLPDKFRNPDPANTDSVDPFTSLTELLLRRGAMPPLEYDNGHRSAHWLLVQLPQFLTVCNYLIDVYGYEADLHSYVHGVRLAAALDVDDKVGNGFTVVLQKYVR